MNMGRIAGTLRKKLSDAFSPDQLEIEDDSARHAGHAGATPGGESHFNIRIRAAAFAGQSRVARQRMVYRVLAAEWAGPVPALTHTALAPDEAR
ncbi:MAG: BolA family protein [Phenylobacterium sp.]